MLDPDQGYVIQAGQCAVRTGFHDQVEGLALKRRSRIRETIEAWGEATEVRVLTCPAGLADAVLAVQLPNDRTAWLVVGGVYLEKPDLRKKRAYARHRGFDPTEYLAAVGATGVVAETDLQAHVQFLSNLVASQVGPVSDSRPCGQDESKYQEIFELMNDAVYLMDGLDFVLVNRKAEELFGVEAGKLFGSTPIDFSPEYQPSGELSTAVASELLRKAFDGEPQLFDWRHRKADGTEFDAEISLTALSIDNKRYVLAVGRDVSEWKRINRELKLSREQYKIMYRTAFVGLFRTRISDGKFLWLNQVTAEYFGYDSPEAAMNAGVRSSDFYSEEDRVKLLADLAEHGFVEDRVVRFQYAEKKSRDIALTIKAYPEQGYLEGVAIDITARLQLEEEIKKSRDLYKSLYSTAQVGLFMSRLSDGTFLKVNQTGAEILGYASPEEVYAANCKATDYYSVEEREKLVQALQDQGQVDEYLAKFHYPDGSQKDIAVTIKAYPELDYMEGVAFDVTRRRQIEEELESYRHKLELMVEERTRQVEQFRRFVENSNQGMGWVDLEGNIKYLNSKMCEILQIENEETMLGSNIHDMYDPETRQMLERELYPQLMQHGTARIVMSVTLPDGRQVPTENNMYLLRDAAGRPQYAANVLTDLTERIKAEEAIKALNRQLAEANENLSSVNMELQAANEGMQATVEELRTTNEELEIAQSRIEQFQRFVETSNQGMGWVDLDGTIRYLNLKFREMLGIGEDVDLTGRKMSEFYGMAAHKHIQEKVIHDLYQHGECRLELEATSIDGRLIPTENNLYMMRDRQGQPQYVASVVTDLTERFKAEQEVRDLNLQLSEANDNLSAMNQELQAVNEEMQATNQELIATNEDLDAARRELVQLNDQLEQKVEERTTELRLSQELFNLATTAANVGLWDFNPQTNEIYRYNDIWFTMLGFEPGEPGDYDIWQGLIHPDDREQVAHQLASYLQGETADYAPVFRMRTKSGSYRWILARGEIVARDEAGQPVRMTGTHTDITELKRIEQELSRTQLELKNSYLEMVQIFDTASSGMRVVELNGEVKYANRKLADICGCAVSDLTSPVQRYLSIDCVDKPRDDDPGQLEPGSHELREITIQRPDGDERICEIRRLPYLDYQGNVVGILEDIRDITDRKQAEEQRKRYIDFLENLERFDRLMRQQDDPEKLLQSMLETIHEMFGGDRTLLSYPCDPSTPTIQMPYEIVNDGFNSLSGKFDLSVDDRLREYLQAILETTEPLYENWQENPVLDEDRRASSQIRSMLCYPLFPRIGKPWAFAIHNCAEMREYSDHDKRLFKEIANRLTDVISNMLYYRNLTASEKRFKSLVANLPGTIYRLELVDGEFKQVFVSDNVMDLVGLPAPEFIEGGRSFQQYTHPDDRVNVREVMRQAINADRPFQIEYRVIDHQGGVHWVHESGRKHIEDQEERVFIDGEIFDITEQKEWVNKLEELNTELARANQDLFTKNEEMTAINEELTATNEALAHSQKELKESQGQLIQSEKLAAIGELASGVAHELNQPLNHISITAQLLERMLSKEGVAVEDIISELGVIRGSVNRAVSIIRNMRDFSRQDTETGASPVDVRTAVANALSMFGAQLRTHNIDLRVEQPDWPVLIMGVENNLVQVVINLVTNARDALDACPDKREKHIIVRIDADQSHATLSVRDNGTGIPAQVLPNVFNPFFTTKEPGAGTGLGLSITHRIVENLGGKISAQSEEGDGANIIVRIPRITDAGPSGGQGG